MAQATISARVDSKDKERFDEFCENVGGLSLLAVAR